MAIEITTGDLARDPSLHRIVSIEPENRSIRVTWDDGHESEFHYLWLRDNCSCATCRHPHSLERTVDLLALPDEMRPAEAIVTNSGTMQIMWMGGGHVSAYEPGWLRSHCYSDRSRALRKRSPRLWDAKLGNKMPTARYENIMENETGLLAWLEALRDYGVSLIRDAPTRPREVTRIAGRIGRIRETNFGRHFDVVSMAEPNSNAYTALHVGCHTDLPNRTLPPGLQFLHCLKISAKGGGTMLVDGFYAAEKMRRQNRSAFDLLCRVPVKFRYQDAESDFVHSAPTIELGADGEIVQIRFNRSVMGVFDVPSAEMDEVYQAHLAFATLVRDPALELRIRVAPGDVLVFDNRRVLHGREAYDPSSGERHLQGCYVDIDEMLSRMRVLERRP